MGRVNDYGIAAVDGVYYRLEKDYKNAPIEVESSYCDFTVYVDRTDIDRRATIGIRNEDMALVALVKGDGNNDKSYSLPFEDVKNADMDGFVKDFMSALLE